MENGNGDLHRPQRPPPIRFMENGNGDLHRPQRPPPHEQHAQSPPYPAPPAHEQYPQSSPYSLPGPSVYDILDNGLHCMHIHEEHIALHRYMMPYIVPGYVLPAQPGAPVPAAGEVPLYHMYFPLICHVSVHVEAQIFPHLVPASAPGHAVPAASFPPPSHSSISPDHHAQIHNGTNQEVEAAFFNTPAIEVFQYYRYIPLIRRQVGAQMFPPLGRTPAPAAAPPVFPNGGSSQSSTDHAQIHNETNEGLEAAFFNTPADEVPQYHMYFPLLWQVRRHVEPQIFRHLVPTLAPHPPPPSFSASPPAPHSSPVTDHAQMPNGTLNEGFKAASPSSSEDNIQLDHAITDNIQLHHVRRQEPAEAVCPHPSASPDHAQLHNEIKEESESAGEETETAREESKQSDTEENSRTDVLDSWGVGRSEESEAAREESKQMDEKENLADVVSPDESETAREKQSQQKDAQRNSTDEVNPDESEAAREEDSEEKDTIRNSTDVVESEDVREEFKKQDTLESSTE